MPEALDCQAKTQWQGNNMRADPVRPETEQYWKSILEREVSYNNNAQWT